MKRKMTAIILGLSIFNTFYVHAAPDINISKETVNVTAVVEPGTKAILYVFKTGTEEDSEVLAMKQATADGNGNVKFSFAVPTYKNSQSSEGEYSVIVKQTNGVKHTGDFFYASANARENIISQMKSGDIYNVLDNSENEPALRALGIELDMYRSLDESEKKKITDMTEEIMKDTKEAPECYEAVNYALSVFFLNSDKESPSDTYITKMGLSFDGISYASIHSNDLRKFITDYLYKNRKYDSYRDVSSAYAAANALYIINGTRYTGIKEVLRQYKDVLGIGESKEYNKYTGLKSFEKADKKIVEILKKTPVESVEDLLEAIEKGVEAESKKSSGSSFGGGGGGGGSFSPPAKNNISGVPVTVPTEEKKKVYFSDISGMKWAEEAIYALAEKGIVSGDGDGKYYPDRALTREEFVKMIVVAANVHDKNAKCNFSDVSQDKWYYSYIASAFENKMVNGISENEFGVGRYLSRQDMAVMCSRGIKGIKQLENVREYIGFADEKSISDYAIPDVQKLYTSGIINGIDGGCFNPHGVATRAQAAVIIYNLFR